MTRTRRRRDSGRLASRAWLVVGVAFAVTVIAAVVATISAADPDATSGPRSSAPPTSIEPLVRAPAPAIRLSTPVILYAARDAHPISGTVRVSNVGDAVLRVSDVRLSPSRDLQLAGQSAFTVPAGGHRDVTFSLNPSSVGPQRATLRFTSNDPKAPETASTVGGLVIDNIVTSEPSLQWIIDAYGIPATDGDRNPTSYSIDASSIPPPGGLLVTAFNRRDASLPVRVTALAAFVDPSTIGDPSKDPAWGWMAQHASPDSATDTYGLRRGFIGQTYTIVPAGTFELWVRAEGTLIRTDRNSVAAPRFVAFPVTGAPGTYVVAVDTTGRTNDDWNDLPLLVQNVTTVPA